MPEDVTRDLKAFTPVGLDRDAILFAAGKAAARRGGWWKWLAAALIVSNAVSLGILFWPNPSVNPSQPVAEPSPLVEPPEPFRPEPYSYIALRQGGDAPTAADPGPASPPPVPLTPRAIHDLRIP
jgi:hypothetical protein